MHRRLAALFGLALMVALAVPGAAAAKPTPSTTPRLVASLPGGDDGSFGESLAVHGANLYVSLTTWGPDELSPNVGQVWKITPNGRMSRFGAALDVCILSGLAFDDRGALYVGTYSCDVDFTEASGVFRIGPDGTTTRVVTLPAGAFPNGLAFHDGYLFISDPTDGSIWRVRPQAGRNLTPSVPWLANPLLAPDPEIGLGVNGLAFRGSTLAAVNYSTGSVITIPLRWNGTPGTPIELVTDPGLVTGDGIAFDVRGRLWITVNDGSLARVSASGAVTFVNSDPAWLDYPTQPAFGATGRDATTLYVVNGSMQNGLPNVVAFDAGVAGTRIP